MTSDNLTRDEAATRSALITVASYQVDLDLTGGDTTFSSVSVVRFGCAAPGSSTFINLTAPAVREITLNDTPVSLDAFDGNRITLTGLAADNVLRVAADCAYSRSGEGLHRFTDPADGHVYLYSDLETFDAHRIYACFDQPDMKASYELAVTAPADWQVVSNMAPESTIPDGTAPDALSPAAGRSAGTSRRRRSCPPTSRRSRPAPTTWSAMSTTASRSACTAGSRWPPTSTPTRSSR